MTYRILIVDDERVLKLPYGDEIVHVDNADDGFIQMVYHGPWDEVWLDHDLGMSSINGYEMVSDIVDDIERQQLRLKVGQFYIHSMNPDGARNIYSALLPYFPVKRIDPTPYLDLDRMKEKRAFARSRWDLWEIDLEYEST
jgi:hypothetical protein